MKVKYFKEILSRFSDDDNIIFKSSSGMSWEVNSKITEDRNASDKKEKVCEVFIK